MDYSSLVRDFAERTQHNLQLVRRAQEEDNEAYEVTQLINSMLGLLILPVEHMRNAIPATSLEEMEADGWPTPLVSGGFAAPRDLRDLMRMLRNSIAHFNLEFLSDSSGQITGICLWNTRRGTRTWQVTLSLSDLEGLTDRFIDLLLDTPEDRRQANAKLI